jgi:hypothetical protein
VERGRRPYHGSACALPGRTTSPEPVYRSVEAVEAEVGARLTRAKGIEAAHLTTGWVRVSFEGMRRAGSVAPEGTRGKPGSQAPRGGSGSISPRFSVPSPGEYHEVERTDDYVIATWQKVMILAWCGAETAEGILRSRTLMERWAAKQEGGVVLVILMPPSAPNRPPNDAARAAMVQASKNPHPGFKGIAMITHHGGFIGAAIRSVMTARQLLVRDPVPFRMFSTAIEAAPWVLAQAGLPETLTHELARIVEASP